MEHEKLTTLECCDWSWPLSTWEQSRAAEDGIPAYALTGLMHVCCLEPGHQDLCLCLCGASQ